MHLDATMRRIYEGIIELEAEMQRQQDHCSVNIRQLSSMPPRRLLSSVLRSTDSSTCKPSCILGEGSVLSIKCQHCGTPEAHAGLHDDVRRF